MASTTIMPKIYTLEQIESAIASNSKFYTDLINAIRDGFQSYSNGQFNACPIQTMGAPPMAPFSSHADEKYSAQVCVKSGYVTDASYFVIKVAGGGHPFPSNTGLLQLYSTKTGQLEALLLDQGILTEMRTAAAGAVAMQACFASEIKCIGMLGTGVQARYQLRFLQHVTKCRTVLVYGRTPDHVETYVKDMTKEGWVVETTNDPNELLKRCDVVVTTTSARRAILLPTNDRKSPQHITCIGADAPGKLELDPKLVAEADLLIADSKAQTKVRGEFQMAIKQGLVSLDSNVVELGDWLTQKQQQHSRDTPLFSIFDSSGVAVQDCVVAQMVYDLLET